MTLSKSEQARADAMADAETLQRMARKPRYIFGVGPAAESPLHATARLGRIVISNILSGGIDDVVFFTRSAARAAFRAVPGLRG